MLKFFRFTLFFINRPFHFYKNDICVTAHPPPLFPRHVTSQYSNWSLKSSNMCSQIKRLFVNANELQTLLSSAERKLANMSAGCRVCLAGGARTSKHNLCSHQASAPKVLSFFRVYFCWWKHFVIAATHYMVIDFFLDRPIVMLTQFRPPCPLALLSVKGDLVRVYNMCTLNYVATGVRCRVCFIMVLLMDLV